MNSFTCDHCGARLFFENTSCLSCGCTIGFLPSEGRIASLEWAGNGLWQRTGGGGQLWRKCRNYEIEGVCNWMIPAHETAEYCPACALNRTIPNISDPAKRALWAKMEAAKHRLCYALLRLGLALIPKSVDEERGLAFDFLADPDPQFNEGRSEERILTGHQNGVITINLAEADDAVREKMRLDMREVYRTLLGHFRHETGHYFWDRLVRDDPAIDEVRAVFGDERLDYGEALQRHYAEGPPEGWGERFVTPYAAAHPWEDWAETWAHYLHILDTLETAAAQGVHLAGEGGIRPLRDPYIHSFGEILDDWHALRIVLNSLNRSMGLPDAYPFVISPAIAAKLRFLHEWIA